MNNEEKYYTSLAMRTYGGSFVQSLGMALTHADPVNTKKLANAFPEYFNKYKEMGKEIQIEKEDDPHRI